MFNFFSNSNQKVSEPEIIEEQDSYNDISENDNEEEYLEDSEDSEESEEDKEDNDTFEAMLKLQYEGAVNDAEKWKRKAKKLEKKFDKQKVVNKKLKEQLDESRYCIETIDGKIDINLWKKS